MEDTKGVAFDLDDVLLDTESNLDWLYIAFRKTLAEYGINSSQENLQKIHSKNLHRFDKISKELEIRSEEFCPYCGKLIADRDMRKNKE